MAVVGDHIFRGWNPANAVLRGLHLLLRAQQSKLEDHQPAHLIVYLLSNNIAIRQSSGERECEWAGKVKLWGWDWEDGKG